MQLDVQWPDFLQGKTPGFASYRNRNAEGRQGILGEHTARHCQPC